MGRYSRTLHRVDSSDPQPYAYGTQRWPSPAEHTTRFRSLTRKPAPLSLQRQASQSPFGTLWPNKSTPSGVGGPARAYKPKHIPIEISPSAPAAAFRVLKSDSQNLDFLRPSLPILTAAHNETKPGVPLVKPRHVPILIPDFAEPFQERSPAVRAVPQACRRQVQVTGVQREPSLPPTSTSKLRIQGKARTHFLSHWQLFHNQNMSTATANMNNNNNQTSFDAGREEQNGHAKPVVAQSQSTGVSPAINQQSVMSPGASGPTNLSGLVCNVHRTTGREPHALVGATTTILGDKLYVFGGRVLSRTRPQLTSDLYELDLIRRHWTKLETSGDVPPPRYFHSVCALGDTKLVCYGGMSPATTPSNQSASNNNTSQQSQDPQPEVVVMSDIHIYDVLTKVWMCIPTAETPQGRYAHCATILPSSAVFTSANAPLSAIHHNPASSNPHQGSIGVALDGTGGAEMVVVGGQDSSNHYIEQISVFNLRSLKWTATSSLGRCCGAYRSVVAPLTGMPVSAVGKGTRVDTAELQRSGDDNGSSMLIYSNYNFLDVKLELQVRLPDGRLSERPMAGQVSPPGLRFPNGGVIDTHFVVSGTYLTSSKQEYALWALDLRSLTWGRIDAGGSVFGQGSWNRGVLWNRRNTFVILGHRKRSLVEDYNHRRINFSHICMVELEAFGLYDNPRRTAPTSGYTSMSSAPMPASFQVKLAHRAGGGRPYSAAAEQLGQAALGLRELADMDIVAINGERIPVNSHILALRWGPYFNHLLKESAATTDMASDAATLRPNMLTQASRNSAVTITPSLGNSSSYSGASTLVNNGTALNGQSNGIGANLELPDPANLTPASRPRTLYLPHTHLTLQLLVRYLYTSSLPPPTSPLCSAQILCSLLQLARPYQIDGLLEATVERLHQILDGRNAAAVFNAAAMAAGGGRATSTTLSVGGTLEALNQASAAAVSADSSSSQPQMVERTVSQRGRGGLRINTSFNPHKSNGRGHDRDDSVSSASTQTSANSTDFSATDPEFMRENNREVWTGDVSSVIGLQKRGLRGLMEGRRLRERGASAPGEGPSTGADGTGRGLGIA